MNTIFVLIWVLASDYTTIANINEFNSKESCEAAGKFMAKHTKPTDGFAFLCQEK